MSILEKGILHGACLLLDELLGGHCIDQWIDEAPFDSYCGINATVQPLEEYGFCIS
jgi:hypothetical protein